MLSQLIFKNWVLTWYDFWKVRKFSNIGSPLHSDAHICEKKKSDFWFCSLNQNIIRIPGCEPGRGGARNCVCMHSTNDHTPMKANSHVSHVLSPQPCAFIVPQETDSFRPLNRSVHFWRVFRFVTLGGAPAPSLLPDGVCIYYREVFFFFFFSIWKSAEGKDREMHFVCVYTPEARRCYFRE